MNSQREFNFDGPGSADGYSQWVTARKLLAAELARRIGLPLGHQVEVWLLGGIRLRGMLRLPEELLSIEEDRVRYLELMVDRTSFTFRELESCVRLD